MKSVLYLLLSDLKAFKGWFGRQTFGKSFVLAGFLAVFAFVSFGLYTLSGIFFNPLTLYGAYGILTASYILQAAIIMLSLFIIGTSVASTLTSLLSQNLQMDYLLTLPLPPKILTASIFIRNSIANLLLFLIVFCPIGLSFIKVFSPDNFYPALIRLIFVLLTLVLATNAIGSFLGFYISRYIKGRGAMAALFGTVFFLGFLFAVFKIIFPQNLLLLYSANLSQFNTIYQSLPLSNSLLPSYWFTQSIVGGGMPLLYTFVFCILLVVLFFYYEEKSFINVYQLLKVNTTRVSKSTKSYYKMFISTNYSIILKDTLSITRTGTELGYLIFLTLLGVLFFLIINFSGGVGGRAAALQNQLIVFSFLAFLFYATAYVLRLIFPLMAREGDAGRFIFSLPLNKKRVYFSKLTLSLVLSFPYLAMSFLVWVIFPYGKTYFLFLSVVTLVSVFLITILGSLTGAIFPNFSEGANAEKVSTSAMGIATLIFSLAVAFLNANIIYLVVTSSALGANLMLTAAVLYIIATLLLYLLFSSRFNSYEF